MALDKSSIYIRVNIKDVKNLELHGWVNICNPGSEMVLMKKGEDT